MSRYNRIALAIVLTLGLLAGPVSAEITLNYLGAFKLPTTGTTNGIYGGDIAYYPGGNNGAGSLFVSRGTINTSSGYKEIYEVTIPALTNTTDVNALSAATVLQGFDTGINPLGMTWRSTDDKLYFTNNVGASSQQYRSINRDGTSESATSTSTWAYVGNDIFQVPDAWATNYAGGKNLVAVGAQYGICLQAVDPWNPTVTPKALVKYDATHSMTGYDYNDIFNGATWATVGSESYIIVAGKDNSAGAATLWFYNANDVANATQSYQPQPFKTMVVQDKLFAATTGGKELWGLTFDSTNQILYGYEGAYNKPTIVHAWSVPEPATMTLILLGGALLGRRRPGNR